MDWSQLLPELLNLVSKKLHDVLDVVRFRAVCPQWRSAVPLSYHRPFLPWIVGEEADGEHLYFVSPFSQNRVRIPGARAMEVLGSSHGYVVVTQSYRLKAMNPLTGLQIPLPPVIHPFDDLPDHARIPNPIWGENGAILLYWPTSWRFSFFRPGDRMWTTLKWLGCREHTLFQGRLFLVKDGDTKVIEPTTLQVVCVIPSPPAISGDQKGRLVVSSGELLRVIMYGSGSETRFQVLRLHQRSGDDPRWIETTDIGDHALLLAGCSFRAGCSFGFSCKASDVELRSNSIYLMERNFPVKDARELGLCRCRWLGAQSSTIYRYDIKDAGRSRELCFVMDGCYHWFVPSLC